MSFLKDKEKDSGIWDYVIFAAIILGALGFWLYYRGEKNSTIEGFDIADSLFNAGEYQQSLDKYNELKLSDYLEPSHDSVLSDRFDTLYTLLGIE
ncbi:MAG: hypothetical protein HQK83_08370 [Fibrobacteria bacterium]|nr:hypothetical protein [Fibrobacteria bacterium]